jgi:3-hydroxybutyryl-CoA dehydrogenase
MAVRSIAVIGAGVMGRGIALVAAKSGFDTKVIEPSQKAIDSARAEVDKIIARGKEKGELDDAAAQKISAITYATTTDAAKGSDLVIEAVPEQVPLKADLYAKLATLLGPTAILATNTSGLSITELAATSDRAPRFIGMHFFNPVHRMRLVELIRGLETSDETLATTEEVAKAMGKETVVVRESPGFVTSRINALIGNEAFTMLEGGRRVGARHRQGPQAGAQSPHGTIRDGRSGGPGHPPQHPRISTPYARREVPPVSAPRPIRQGRTPGPQGRARRLRLRRLIPGGRP